MEKTIMKNTKRNMMLLTMLFFRGVKVKQESFSCPAFPG